MFGSASVLDECVVVRPVKVPNRLSALTIAQRCAAQNGQYSPPMYSTSGLPPDVSGVPLTVAKYGPELRRRAADGGGWSAPRRTGRC